jgi:quinoprotein glucose dehydrogenase
MLSITRVLCLTLSLSMGLLLAADGDWPLVGGRGGMHYSTLNQINRRNVVKLRQAWRYDSHDEFDGSEMECNPVVVEGVVYATTPRLRVIALDGVTGRLIWDFDAHRGQTGLEKQRNRGVAYWSDGREARIFVGIDEYLYALDARTGKPVPEFGDGGRVDLHDGLGEHAKGLTVGATSPGVIYKDLLIQGTLVAEDLPAAPGDIRAFDVHTGKIRWTFHTIPLPGEFGADTWPANARETIGAANSWAGLTLDDKRGIVYAPTGSAAFDFYGANRIGNNLFANCELALKADTGERVWHFQVVHHDAWDRDLPTAPTLVQVHKDGRLIDALAQPTKNGFVWVFDRDTGQPLYPYHEVQVQPSDVDGEKLSPTQPLPDKPAPFARQQLTAEMLTNRTPEVHEAVLARFRGLRSGPQFTPASLQGTIVFPGFDGGAEWGGAAWDPETGVLYVNANEMAWVLRLVPRSIAGAALTGGSLYRQNCSGCHRQDLKGTPPEFPSLVDIAKRRSAAQVTAMVRKGGGRMPGFSQLGDAATDAIVRFIMTGEEVHLDGAEWQKTGAAPRLKYGIDGYNRFLDSDGFPAIAPPWGTLNALNLNTADYVWKQPFGAYPQLAAQGLGNTGSENYGGAVVTAGGLLFIGATNFDRKFHAFDKRNGELLWETTLPAAGNATPAIYEVNGREYVVIAAGGGKSGAPSGGSYVAFSLQ